MDFKPGDYVESIVCNRISGKIKKILSSTNFILQVGDKEILCHTEYYKKVI